MGTQATGGARQGGRSGVRRVNERDIVQKTKGIIFASVVAGTMAWLCVGCKPHAPQQQQMPPPPVVTVATVQQQELVEWEEFTGRTAAIENVEVRSRVSGHIEAVKFQSGQLVKKGDVLFQLDSRWYQADYDRHAADYEQAKEIGRASCRERVSLVV